MLSLLKYLLFFFNNDFVVKAGLNLREEDLGNAYIDFVHARLRIVVVAGARAPGAILDGDVGELR